MSGSLAALALALLGLGDPDAPAAFRRDLAAWYGGRVHVSLHHKGRVALHAVCRALGLGPGDEAVLPGYTCFVVPQAFLPLGVRPVYVDVEPGGFNCTPEALLAAVGPRTRLVLVQHTYGLGVPVAPVVAACRPRGIAVVEDCCHAFGTRVDGRLAGTLGDAAFLSGQWNKPFSTGLGGMLLVSDPDLAARVDRVTAGQAVPGTGEEAEMRALLLAHAALVGPRTHGLVQAAYRAASGLGLVTGSSSPEELSGRLPAGYFRRMTVASAQTGRIASGRFPDDVAHRRGLQDRYHALLAAAGLEPAAVPAGSVLSRYPVRVAGKAALVQRAALAGVELGSWFETPLHPLPLDRHEAFGYRPGSCPNAEAAAASTVNLPIHAGTTPRDAERAVRFLAREGRRAR